MKAIFLISLLLISPAVLADSIFDTINQGIDDFWSLLTVETPSMIERFFAWFLAWWIKFKIEAQIELTRFAWAIAKVYLEELSMTTILQTHLNAVPSDIKHLLQTTRALDAFMLIIEASITKYIMRFI